VESDEVDNRRESLTLESAISSLNKPVISNTDVVGSNPVGNGTYWTSQALQNENSQKIKEVQTHTVASWLWCFFLHWRSSPPVYLKTLACWLPPF
jgi:hypothetical protein